MSLIKEWKEGVRIPQGLSYRKFDGKSLVRNGVYLTVWRLSLQAEWHMYKPAVYNSGIQANPTSRPAYTLDFTVAWL